MKKLLILPAIALCMSFGIHAANAQYTGSSRPTTLTQSSQAQVAPSSNPTVNMACIASGIYDRKCYDGGGVTEAKPVRISPNPAPQGTWVVQYRCIKDGQILDDPAPKNTEPFGGVPNLCPQVNTILTEMVPTHSCKFLDPKTGKCLNDPEYKPNNTEWPKTNSKDLISPPTKPTQPPRR